VEGFRSEWLHSTEVSTRDSSEPRMLSSTIRRRLASGLLAAMAGIGISSTSSATAPDRTLGREPSWSMPSREAIRGVVDRWPAGSAAGPVDPAGAAAVRAAWDDVAAGRGDLVEAVVQGIATRDARVAGVVAAAERGEEPPLAWLADPTIDAFVRDAVSLWWGRELVRQSRFDEALPLLARLDVAAAVDPAALLFHRAACEHWLLDADAAIASLDRLLEREGEIPVRYAQVAKLLRADIADLDGQSLDHISRRMRDAARRLALGSAGPTTREVQEGVIASLDALIERLEDQQRDQQGESSAGAGGGAGQGGGGRPMDDSRVVKGRGTGEVRQRQLAPGEAWGNLPPHDRERALQQIGREFPPHYREAIEQYFKRLATGEEDR